MMTTETPDAPIEKAEDTAPTMQDSTPAAPTVETPASAPSDTPTATSAYAQAAQPTSTPVYTQQTYQQAAPTYAQPSQPAFSPGYQQQTSPFYRPEPMNAGQAMSAQSAEPRLAYLPQTGPAYPQAPQPGYSPSYTQQAYQPAAPTYPQQAATGYPQPQPSFAQSYQPQTPPAYTPEFGWIPQPAPNYQQPAPSMYPQQTERGAGQPMYQPAGQGYAQQGYPSGQPQQHQQAYPVDQQQAPQGYRPAQQMYQPAASPYTQPSQQGYPSGQPQQVAQGYPSTQQPSQQAYAQQSSQQGYPSAQQQQQGYPSGQQAYQPARQQKEKTEAEPFDTSEFSWNVYDFPKPKIPRDIPIKWPEYDYTSPAPSTFPTPDSRIQAAIANKQPVVMVSPDATEGFVAVPDQRETAWKEPLDESTRRNEQFFTFQTKNEEFQRLLDREYQKLQGRQKGEAYREEAFNMPQEDFQAQRNAQLQAGMQPPRTMQGFAPSPMYQQGQQQTPYNMQQFQSQQPYGGQSPMQQSASGQYMPSSSAYRHESITEFERMLMDNTKDADFITGDTLPINLEKIQEEVRAQEAARLKQHEGAYEEQQNKQRQAEQEARSSALSSEMERLATEHRQAESMNEQHLATEQRQAESINEQHLATEQQQAKSMNEERLAAMAKAREEYFRTISGLADYPTSSGTINPSLPAAEQAVAAPEGGAQGKDQVSVASEGQAQNKDQTVAAPETDAATKDHTAAAFEAQIAAREHNVSAPEVRITEAGQAVVVSKLPVQEEAPIAVAPQVQAQGKDHAAAAFDASEHARIEGREQTARPEDKRTKASLETTSLERPIEELFAPIEEDIKASGKKGGAKKHHVFGKLVLIILLVLALAELTLFGMKNLIPDNDLTLKGTEIEQNVIGTLSGFGESIGEFVTNTLEKLGLAKAEEEMPEGETPEEQEPVLDLGAIVTEYNENIKSITESPTLVYSGTVTYEIDGLGEMAVVEDLEIKEAIYGCLISFNSKWVDYVNGGEDDSCLDLLKADGAAYRSALNFSKIGEIEEEFQSLMLGEVRMSDTAYYIFAREMIAVTEDGKTRTKSYSWIYQMEDVAGEMKIVDYTPF